MAMSSLLENVRFHPGEEKNDPEFKPGLGRSWADVYVNDAPLELLHRAPGASTGRV